MGRRRNRYRRRQQQQQQRGECPAHNNGENTNEENKKNPDGVIVLGVYVHCEGCGDEVLRCLRGFEGVEEIEIDAKNHKVIVKGKKADPIKVAERLRKKSGKHVNLISPIPPKEEPKEEKKPEPPMVIEVVLKIYLHCEGCAKEVKHLYSQDGRCAYNAFIILVLSLRFKSKKLFLYVSMKRGVQTVDPEMEKNLVTVKGSMDAQKLVEFINKRAGRHAEIVKQTNKEKKNETNENQNENRNGSVYPNYPQDLVYAPQLFSDENPNSCSIM
ncbi:Heavy metal transport/detoxification superfamily protein [Forsythia ovata]|uniref:Heavy metal transport/detoxification superfamily protein n=1 Tax=Forsythia ovata TaxID=205694 RepID=A0ABD1WC43_9LAMI